MISAHFYFYLLTKCYLQVRFYLFIIRNTIRTRGGVLQNQRHWTLYATSTQMTTPAAHAFLWFCWSYNTAVESFIISFSSIQCLEGSIFHQFRVFICSWFILNQKRSSKIREIRKISIFINVIFNFKAWVENSCFKQWTISHRVNENKNRTLKAILSVFLFSAITQDNNDNFS